MTICPVYSLNNCDCPVDDCAIFDEFGMCCDSCFSVGHKDAYGWVIQASGEVWCKFCHIKNCGTNGLEDGFSPPWITLQPPNLRYTLYERY